MSRLRKRLPTRLEPHSPPSPQGNPALQFNDGLAWVVAPNHGDPFEYDVQIFSQGSREEGITARPALIHALASALRSKTRSKSQATCWDYSSSLKHFWRFLDQQEASALPPKELMDIGDADGVLFRTFLLRDLRLIAAGRRSMYTLRELLSRAQRERDPSRQELLWPSVDRPRGTHKDVDPIIIRPLYSVLKRQFYSLIQATEEGARLAKIGSDPRAIGDGEDPQAWSAHENIACLTEKYVNRIIAGKASLADFSKRLASPEIYGLPICAPAGALSEPSVFDRIRWFAPTSTDTVTAFLLVLAQFGWNPEVVANIDVSHLDAWCDERLKRTEASADATVAIYGFKGRSGKEQISPSREPSHDITPIRSSKR